jgi:hypothetical protein
MMRFKIEVEVELDAFNADSAKRRVEDLLSKANCKKFQERNTEVRVGKFVRVDKEEE